MMVDHLGDDPGEAKNELDKTSDSHANFEYLKKIYTIELQRAQHDDNDDEQVVLHRLHALRAYPLYLVDTLIVVDKSSTYTDVVYLRYFVDFEWIHEYNWG